jgi:hypothetical protein
VLEKPHSQEWLCYLVHPKQFSLTKLRGLKFARFLFPGYN